MKIVPKTIRNIVICNPPVYILFAAGALMNDRSEKETYVFKCSICRRFIPVNRPNVKNEISIAGKSVYNKTI